MSEQKHQREMPTVTQLPPPPVTPPANDDN